MKVKALSLQQPYANWVAEGKKTIETRKWTTKYRGDILICASQSGAGEPHGVALCLVRLVGMRPMTEADEAAGCVALYPRAQAWLIEDVRVLRRPFAVKGQLGLFNVEVPEAALECYTRERN
ncbi:MAG TPA: ASCH domain-containing protein [Candidatus Saccharimonadia bacterium]|nr:ASCH domain-containing protein [Candidatus Saccharimonadia bacterium]